MASIVVPPDFSKFVPGRPYHPKPPNELAAALASGSGRFRTVPNVVIFDTHEPKTKYLERADGSVAAVQIGATREDLLSMARNSNRDVSEGHPPSLTLGHFERRHHDAPEHELPRHVGYAHNFRVQHEAEGSKLVADFGIMHDQYGDAMTYPRCSVERAHWDDGARQVVRRVALLRRPPDRDSLPAVAYGAAPEDPAIAYAAAAPWAPRVADPAAEARASAAFVDWCTKNHAFGDMTGARRRFASAHPAESAILDRRDAQRSAAPTLAYSAGPAGPSAQAVRAAQVAESNAIVEFARKHGIRDASMARARFEQAGRPGLPPLAYAADAPAVGAPPAEPRDAFKPDPESVLGPGGPVPLGAVRPPTAPAPPMPPRDVDRSVVTTAPSGGAGLATLLQTPAFAKARANFALLNRVYDPAKATGMLAAELRAGLLTYAAADGRLIFPPAPSTRHGAAADSAAAHYRRRHDAHWSGEAMREAREAAQAGERAARERQLAAATRRPGAGG